MAEDGAGLHDSAPPGNEPVEQDDAGGSEPSGAERRARVLHWIDHVPYLIVLATMSAGIVIVAAAYFKRGPALIAGALLLAAAFRAVLGPERAGMLAVRTRWFDVATFVGLAAVLIVLAWVAPQL